MSRKTIALALATALAVPAEGLRQHAYRDPGPAIATICYGSTAGVKMGDYKTLEQCKAMLNKEMNDAINTVEQCVPGLPVPVLAAFSDAVYNLGPAIACNQSKSTAARLLAAGQLRAACEQLPRWDKSRIAGIAVTLPGLTKRRAAERDLCLQGVPL